MLGKIKKMIPHPLMSGYHKFWAVFADFFHGFPSEKMIVIGVTGTNGKSTTVMLIAEILEKAGFKAGAASTVKFKIADREWLNQEKMTMLGRMKLQKLLKQMVKAGCQYAVIETSSQGIEQYRHLGIHYDIDVFTNLTPEHLEAHGGFENYKKAKLKLFKKLEKEKRKMIGRKEIPKTIIANADDEQAKDFLDFRVDEKILFGAEDGTLSFNFQELLAGNSSRNLSGGRSQGAVIAKNIAFKPNGVSFEVQDTLFDLKLFGRFNVYNSLAAISAALSQGLDLEICRKVLAEVEGLPGRMEFVNEGQDFKVLIDYAPEPESLKQMYQAVQDHGLKKGKIIHVLGSCGGGRDMARRPILGGIAAKNADMVIIANEDPYDDDPLEIINQVAQGAIQAGKTEGGNLFKILDRREAMQKALNSAKKDDLVVLTGKGSEQAICVAKGKRIPWDERQVAREILKTL